MGEIFLCYSSQDRETLVKGLLYHLTNYGLPVWYDRYKLLMGDQRNVKNFDEGVGQSNYAVVVISPNSIATGCGALEELELIYNKFISGSMTVFPVFFNIKAGELSAEFQWLLQLVYKELDPSIDSTGTCYHIICRYLQDELAKYRIQSLAEVGSVIKQTSAWGYLHELIKTYDAVNENNRNAKMAILFSACKYIEVQYSFTNLPAFYYKGVDRLFAATRLNLAIELREMLILERLFLLLLNAAVFGYIF